MRTEDWEAFYAGGEFPWDHGEANPALVHELAVRSDCLAGLGLVPGCGRGHDVRALAARGVPVIGLDVSATAIEMARALDAGAPADRYVVGDLFALPQAWDGRFEWVWEHTCFCAIDPTDRERYAASVARLLRPGGVFLAIFYLRPHDEDDPTLGPPFQVSEAALDRLFTPYFRLRRSWVPERFYPKREGRELMREYERLR